MDANVFVSVVITKGSPRRILQRWLGQAAKPPTISKRSRESTSLTSS